MRARRLPGSLTSQTLTSVWKASRDSKSGSAGAPGIDQLTAVEFAKDLQGQIHRIRESVRRGSFSFRPLRVVPIPKKGGRTRLVAIPPVGDRLVQRAICNHLNEDAKFPKTPKIAYGFVPGRSLRDAHLAAAAFRDQAPWVLQTDIISFFDEILREDVKAAVARTVQSKIIRELIFKAVDTELDYSDPLTSELARANGVKRRRGLRQGMPLSPLLSNLVMRPADQALLAGGYRAVRYADDLAIFCSSRSECLEAFEAVTGILKPLGLRLPKLEDGGKTTISQPSQGCEILGVEVRPSASGYKLCVPKGRADAVERQLLEISNVEHCARNRVSLSRMLAHYDAVVRGHREAVHLLEGADQHFARLDAARGKAQRALLISILGKGAVEQLTDVKQAVLGLKPFPL